MSTFDTRKSRCHFSVWSLKRVFFGGGGGGGERDRDRDLDREPGGERGGGERGLKRDLEREELDPERDRDRERDFFGRFGARGCPVLGIFRRYVKTLRNFASKLNSRVLVSS